MKGKRIFVVICLVTFVISAGAMFHYKEVFATINRDVIIPPKDFGQGLYYFTVEVPGLIGYVDAGPEVFGRSLAAFQAQHPNLKVTAIAPRKIDASGGFGYLYTTGYFVNFEKK